MTFVAVYHILISFPFSQSTYNSPYTRTKELVFYAEGKFVYQYYHWREQGIKVGLFEKRNSNTLSVTNNVEGNTLVKLLALPLWHQYVKYLYYNSSCIFPELNCNASEEKSLELLTTDLEETAALQHWNVTHNHRMFKLLHDPKLKEIHNYFALYPVVRQPWASSLVIILYFNNWLWLIWKRLVNNAFLTHFSTCCWLCHTSPGLPSKPFDAVAAVCSETSSHAYKEESSTWGDSKLP